MIRGTTAQFKFKLPYAQKALTWVTIKFWQPNNPTKLLPITKTFESFSESDNSDELCVSLDAYETSNFSDKFKAKVQLRAQHTNGTVFASHQQSITVYPIVEMNDHPIYPSANEEGWTILDGNEITTE
jgi:hypothetical protein